MRLFLPLNVSHIRGDFCTLLLEGPISCSRWHSWSTLIACCVFHNSNFFHSKQDMFHRCFVLPSNIVFKSDWDYLILKTLSTFCLVSPAFCPLAYIGWHFEFLSGHKNCWPIKPKGLLIHRPWWKGNKALIALVWSTFYLSNSFYLYTLRQSSESQ